MMRYLCECLSISCGILAFAVFWGGLFICARMFPMVNMLALYIPSLGFAISAIMSGAWALIVVVSSRNELGGVSRFCRGLMGVFGAVLGAGGLAGLYIFTLSGPHSIR